VGADLLYLGLELVGG